MGRHGLDEVLFALTVGGLSQRKVVSWVRRFLGGRLSPATIAAVLARAQEQVAARRNEAIPAGRYRAIVVDGVYLRYRRCLSQPTRKGVLLVAVGVREGGAFEVLDWRAAPAESSAEYEELLTRLWKRGLESVELIVSDGAEAIVSAAQTVYPAAQHQLCLAHWFRNLEALTPRLAWFERRKFRREFWWIWEAENQVQAHHWARRFCARWRWAAPEMVEKFHRSCHACWLSSLFLHAGDTGCAPPTWVKAGSSTCDAISAVSPVAETPNTASKYSAASCSPLNKCIAEPIHAPETPKLHFQQECWTVPIPAP